MLFAEGTPTEFWGAVVTLAGIIFGYLKYRDNQRLKRIEAKSKLGSEAREALEKKVEDLEHALKLVGAEVKDCEEQRRHQEATINRLEKDQIQSVLRENKLLIRVDELEAELKKLTSHDPPARRTNR